MLLIWKCWLWCVRSSGRVECFEEGNWDSLCCIPAQEHTPFSVPQVTYLFIHTAHVSAQPRHKAWSIYDSLWTPSVDSRQKWIISWLHSFYIFTGALWSPQPGDRPTEYRCKCSSHKTWGAFLAWRQHHRKCSEAHREQTPGLQLLTHILHSGMTLLICCQCHTSKID